MNQQRKPLVPKTLTYALASVAFSVPAAWLAVHAGCIIWKGARLCAWPGLYPLAAVLAAMLILAPIGLVYRERARRRAARGMWQRVQSRDWLVTFERSVRAAWGSEEEEPPGLITGEMRYQRRGWYVDVKSGRRIWVDRWQLWQWLVEVEAVAKTLPAGESPIGERRWQGEIGRDLWLGYMEILEQVGAIFYATDDLRSRRYIPGQPWSRVEEYEKVRGSEVR